MTLSEIAPGGRFVVRRVGIPGETGRRLADMGFTEGIAGEMIRGALMRGPVQVRIRGYDLVIRRCEAACVEVERLGSGDPVPGPAAAGMAAAGMASAAERPGRDRDRSPAGEPAPTAPGRRGPFGTGWRLFGRRMAGMFAAHGCCGDAPGRMRGPRRHGGEQGGFRQRGAGHRGSQGGDA